MLLQRLLSIYEIFLKKRKMLDLVDIKSRMFSSPSGSTCYFVPLDNNKGIKIYDCKRTRDSAHKYQTLAAKLGLGPDTYEKVDFDEYYAYITENVGDDACVIWRNGGKEVDSNELHRLKEDLLNKAGFNFTDDNRFNLAYKNDKLVCIDFGESQCRI